MTRTIVLTAAVYPRCDEPQTAETIVVLERLRSQQRWHLLTARRCSQCYLALRIGIVLLGLASAAYVWPAGRQHLAPLALVSTAMLLCLIAYREQLGYAQLCVRSTRIVETLEQIEREYDTQKEEGIADTAQRLEWLRQTAARVERSRWPESSSTGISAARTSAAPLPLDYRQSPFRLVESVLFSPSPIP
jgi:hypothetical protein